MKTKTSLLTISGIILLSMGRVAFAACFDVKTFGAKGDGVADDWPAINAAIGATVLSPNPVVCFPAGTYRVTHAIRPEYDNLTLQGGPGVTIVADPDMINNATDFTYPEAILVSKDNTSPPTKVSGLTIQSLAIQVKAGRSSVVIPGQPPPSSTGAIQLNYCVNCVVSNVTITYTGPTSAPPGDLDGIATSQGTTGRIQGVVVSNIPKAGIYLSDGTHDLIVDQCEVKFTNGPLDQAGFSITGSKNVVVMRSSSHDNGGPGILILVQDATPNTDIIVESSQFNNNGEEGILLSSGVDGNVSTRVQILGVQALNNAWDGILVEAGNQVTIADTEVGYSGIAGIRIDNVPITANGFPRATVIQITNPNVHDSGRLVGIPESGIGLNGAQQVSIAGGHVYRTGTQIKGYGIGLYRNKYGLASNYVNIKDVDATVGVLFPPVATITESGTSDPGAAVQNGYYELSAYGPPGVLLAPVGSVYYDLSGKALYQMQSNEGITTWVLIQVI